MEKGRLSLSSTPESPPNLKTTDLDLSEHDLQLERLAVRKLDCTVLPIMALCYLVSFLDRSNIGNARVAGLQKDLHLTDHQYQICLTVLFVPYIAGEIPAGFLLKKIGPKLLLSMLVTAWGIVATLHGFVSSYTGLIIGRTFIGLLEGTGFDMIVILASTIFTFESPRIALFFSAVSLSGAFSGLLAAAIQNMDGIGGKQGWAWIFIIEGLFSVVIGLFSFFFVPSTPYDSMFLTEKQKHIIMSRLERDRPSAKSIDKFNFETIMRSASSPHVIMLFIAFFMGGTMLYGLAFFLPSIVKQLEFSATKTQLLSVGPYAIGFFVTLISAYLSDRYESRGITIVLISLLGIAGFALYLGAENRYTSYAALYLMVPGSYAPVPVAAAWMANNSEPYYRRATSVALAFIASSSGGILSIWCFPSNEGPKFRKTTIMNLVFSILLFVITFVNMAYLTSRNKIKKNPEGRMKLLEKYVDGSDDGNLKAWIELGDRHPDYVYML